MNRHTMITAFACGLLLSAAAATPALAAPSDPADGTSRSVDEPGTERGDADTLLINGRAFLLE